MTKQKWQQCDPDPVPPTIALLQHNFKFSKPPLSGLIAPAYNGRLHWLQSASEFQSLPPAFLPTAPSLMDEQFPKDCCSNQLNSEEIWRKASDDDVWKVFNAAIVSCRRLSNKQMHKLGSLSSGTPPLAERWQINLRRGEFEFSHPALAPELSPSKIGRISWMI